MILLKRILLIYAILNCLQVIADDMGEDDPPVTNHKYNLGDIVRVDLSGSKYEKKCDSFGIIARITVAGHYQVQRIPCIWGEENSFVFKESQILKVLKPEKGN